MDLVMAAAGEASIRLGQGLVTKQLVRDLQAQQPAQAPQSALKQTRWGPAQGGAQPVQLPSPQQQQQPQQQAQQLQQKATAAAAAATAAAAAAAAAAGPAQQQQTPPPIIKQLPSPGPAVAAKTVSFAAPPVASTPPGNGNALAKALQPLAQGAKWGQIALTAATIDSNVTMDRVFTRLVLLAENMDLLLGNYA